MTIIGPARLEKVLLVIEVSPPTTTTTEQEEDPLNPRWAERPAGAQRFCEGYNAAVAVATGENFGGAAARRADLQIMRRMIQQVLPFISLCEEPQIDPFVPERSAPDLQLELYLLCQGLS